MACCAARWTARKNRPDLLIISGLEWNVPPHKGQGHVVVLVDTPAERQLTDFGPDFTVRDFDISADGREIVVEQVQQHSDLVLIDIPRR